MKGAQARGSLVSNPAWRLSRRVSFTFTGEDLIANSLFHIGELKVGLLQLQTTLTALLVVRLPGEAGTGRSLSSETICNCHCRPLTIYRPHRSIFHPAAQYSAHFAGDNVPEGVRFRMTVRY